MREPFLLIIFAFFGMIVNILISAISYEPLLINIVIDMILRLLIIVGLVWGAIRLFIYLGLW